MSSSELGTQIEYKNFSALETFDLEDAFLTDRGAIAGAQHCSIQSHTSARDLQPCAPAGLERVRKLISLRQGGKRDLGILMDLDRSVAGIRRCDEDPGSAILL